MTRKFDAVIIGTGQAGPALAARFNDAGQSVALVERHKVGGSCVNRVSRFHLAGRLEINHWNGRSRAQLRLSDAAPAE